MTRLTQRLLKGTPAEAMARNRSPKDRTVLLPPVKELQFSPAQPSSTGVRNLTITHKQQALHLLLNGVNQVVADVRDELREHAEHPKFRSDGLRARRVIAKLSLITPLA